MTTKTVMKLTFGFAFFVLIAVGYYAYLFVNVGVPQPSPATIRIGTLFTALDYGPYYVARHKGWFEEALGKNSQIQHLPPFQTPPTANEALAAGEVDIILTAGIPAIVGRAAGIPFRVPWLSCTLQSQVVVPADSESKALKDLRGKRLAVAFGTGPHYGLLKHLEKEGLSRNDVQLINMTPPDAKAAFHARAVDAWAIFPPWIEQELVAGSGKVLPDVTSSVQVVVTVRRDAMSQIPEQVKNALLAMDRAKEWIKTHPGEARTILSKELDLPIAVVELAWPRLDWSAHLADEAVRSDLQLKADFLAIEGFVKTHLDTEKDLIMDINYGAKGSSR